jgi:hypothetical protein
VSESLSAPALTRRAGRATPVREAGSPPEVTVDLRQCRLPDCPCQNDPAAFTRPLPAPPATAQTDIGGQLLYAAVAVLVLLLLFGGLLADR